MSHDHSLAEARFAYEAGDVIAGKYALEALLGAGGMGAVFRARNVVIDMPVAIKLIRADLDRTEFSGRLLQEARAAAKLAHPAIVRVFDVGQTALGDPFIVMELLEGETLSALMEREGRLQGERVIQLLLPIADALSMAHAKGFVHRDVKPDNVFISLSTEGHLQPKLVDFGIVKQDGVGAESHTHAGSVVGSPDYMSPEQARGLESVDLRSDIWSFCVVIFEAITGRAPFEAENYNALLRQIVEAEPPTLRELGAADGMLSAIIAKGLSKDPAQRWASLGQLGRALATWLYERGVGEDACGASLEARWLSRPAEAAGSSAVFASAPPESWPEPPSGVRAVSRLGFAPTLAQSKSAGTPHALTQTSTRPLVSSRRAWAIATAAVVVAVAVVSVAHVWRGGRPVVPREAARAEPAGETPPTPSPEPRIAAESPTPFPALSATNAASAPSASSLPSRHSPSSRSAGLRKPRALVPPPPAPDPQPRPGASDLLSPY